MPDILIDGVPHLERLGRTLPEAREVIARMLSKASFGFANRTVTAIKRDHLSGGADKLKVRTGRLRSSIRFLVQENDNEIDITFGTDVPYAAIHEFGGTTAPHRIEPRRKSFLRFMLGGKEVFSRGVDHPGSRIEARPFLAPGVADEAPRFRQEIDELLERAALDGIDGK